MRFLGPKKLEVLCPVTVYLKTGHCSRFVSGAKVQFVLVTTFYDKNESKTDRVSGKKDAVHKMVIRGICLHQCHLPQQILPSTQAPLKTGGLGREAPSRGERERFGEDDPESKLWPPRIHNDPGTSAMESRMHA